MVEGESEVIYAVNDNPDDIDPEWLAWQWQACAAVDTLQVLWARVQPLDMGNGRSVSLQPSWYKRLNDLADEVEEMALELGLKPGLLNIDYEGESSDV